MNDEMQRYIGTKIIRATEMNLGDYNKYRRWEIPSDEDPLKEGYLVVYPDGYKSWSPKEAFEEAYRVTDSMNFGLALEALKKGLKVARSGWNGKDMYLALTEASSIKPENARSGVVLARANEEGLHEIDICAHIDMRAADGSCVIGWLASQTDMLSDDWTIVE